MSLFKTTTELKLNVNLDVNMAFATMAPYIADAEKTFIIPIIGQELFDELNEQYNAAPSTLTADNIALLPYIQKPLAYYAQLLAINELTVTFGDRGIRDSSSTSDSMPAPRWKQEKLELQILIKADRHADLLLQFLEENATDSKYSLWFDDEELNTRATGLIVRNTAIATKHIEINKSRRIYLRLKKVIKKLESSVAKKLIGAEQYEEIVEQIKTDELSDENILLTDLLEPIISKRSLCLALPLMRVGIGENGGIFLYSGADDLFKLGQYAAEDDIDDYQEALKCGEFGYESDEQTLKQFIMDNIDTYPLIKVSTAYTSRPDPGPTYQPINDSSNGFFSV